VAYTVIRPDDLDWQTRPADPGEARRHTAELSERAGFRHSRANLWRYDPGAKGRRHRHKSQEETYVVVRGTLAMYLGEPPERYEVNQGGVIHVEAATPRQAVNEGEGELLLYAYGWPPENSRAEILESAV
jgi:mannose-6-phosphate isomerase-like protein (cupin superfamily)